jgi:hypothetical protein
VQDRECEVPCKFLEEIKPARHFSVLHGRFSCRLAIAIEAVVIGPDIDLCEPALGGLEL